MKIGSNAKTNPYIKFLLMFIGLYVLLYYFNLFWIGLTAPGGLYWEFAAKYLNYIHGFRSILLAATAGILKLLGYTVRIQEYTIMALNKGGIQLVYSCLGFSVMSFFIAFVIAWPGKPIKNKLGFALIGLVFIQVLNISRFVLLTLFWNGSVLNGLMDHHDLYNIVLYGLLLLMVYLWVNSAGEKLFIPTPRVCEEVRRGNLL